MGDVAIKKAVALLRSGGIVAFPTETVYGLGADATNADAIQKVFAVKNRPIHHPLIVHLANASALDQWALDVTPVAHELAAAFWPGPLTMIFKKANRVLDLVTGGQETVAIRVPRHPVAQNLLQAFGGGIVGPSANLFSRLSPTSAAAVADALGDKIDLILDGGACAVGLESTIIDMSGDAETPPVILRPGMIEKRAIEKVLKFAIKDSAEDESARRTRAPGMHAVHYAPRTKVLLVERAELQKTIKAFTQADKTFAVLAQSDMSGYKMSANHIYVNMPQDADNYAHLLYSTLRSVDHQGCECIIVEMVPEEPEWYAIRDRLMKASAKS